MKPLYDRIVGTDESQWLGTDRLQRHFEEKKKEVDTALRRYLSSSNGVPPTLWKAMRYATLNGGKRFRPVLLLATCECLGGDPAKALPLACALELLHTASLIHDDLPVMDDDEMRRGLPSVHKEFGEAVAVLAGDALILYAFEVATASASGEHVVQSIRTLARAAGARGMAGGQLLDIRGREEHPEKREQDLLRETHLLKTASLMEAVLRIGALSAAGNSQAVERLGRYGHYLGFAFQIVDDILDYETDEADARLSYLNVHGLVRSRLEVARCVLKSKELVAPFGKRAWMLRDLADSVVARGK